MPPDDSMVTRILPYLRRHLQVLSCQSDLLDHCPYSALGAVESDDQAILDTFRLRDSLVEPRCIHASDLGHLLHHDDDEGVLIRDQPIPEINIRLGALYFHVAGCHRCLLARVCVA